MVSDPQDLAVLMAAISTPMHADESLHTERLSALVDSYIGRGVEGIYCCGSSGEGLLLSLDERQRVVETACDAANGRVPVGAHVGCMTTADSIRLARHAQACGVAAVSMIPPIYYQLPGSALIAHYQAMIESISVPMVVYDVPQLTGVQLDSSMMSRLLELDGVAGVKYTSKDMFLLERAVAHHPDKTYIGGFDETLVSAMAAGATGAIGTMIGFQFELFAAARRRLRAGDLAGAQQVQARINEVVAELIAIDVFPAAKYLAGRPVGDLGPCRRPFAPLSRESKARLDRLVDRLAELIELTERDERSGR